MSCDASTTWEQNNIRMRVSIHQPSYWPWLGQLAKIAKSDRYVLLDSVDAVRDDFQYRNLFFCNGQAKFLTLPVNYRVGLPIAELEFRNSGWQDEHLNKLTNYYRKAPFFELVYGRIAPVYAAASTSTAAFLLATMQCALEILDIRVDIVKSSTLPVTGKKAELVLDICRQVEATEYVAGMGSYDYMKEALADFANAHVQVTWHKYLHPEYRQAPSLPFVSGLACLDIFFFQGFDRARQIFWESVHRAS